MYFHCILPFPKALPNPLFLPTHKTLNSFLKKIQCNNKNPKPRKQTTIHPKLFKLYLVS